MNFKFQMRRSEKNHNESRSCFLHLKSLWFLLIYAPCWFSAVISRFLFWTSWYFTNQINVCQIKKKIECNWWFGIKKYGAMYWYEGIICIDFLKEFWEWTACTFCSRLPQSHYPRRFLYLVLEQGVGNWLFQRQLWWNTSF